MSLHNYNLVVKLKKKNLELSMKIFTIKDCKNKKNTSKVKAK